VVKRHSGVAWLLLISVFLQANHVSSVLGKLAELGAVYFCMVDDIIRSLDAIIWKLVSVFSKSACRKVRRCCHVLAAAREALANLKVWDSGQCADNVWAMCRQCAGMFSVRAKYRTVTFLCWVVLGGAMYPCPVVRTLQAVKERNQETDLAPQVPFSGPFLRSLSQVPFSRQSAMSRLCGLVDFVHLLDPDCPVMQTTSIKSDPPRRVFAILFRMYSRGFLKRRKILMYIHCHASVLRDIRPLEFRKPATDGNQS
jgi:hypothetical protein